MNRLSFAIAAALLGLIPAAPPAIAQGTLPPGVLKLHSRGTGPLEDPNFGDSVAVSDTWMVVGEPFNDNNVNNVGAAFVYAATTGRFVRRLTPVPAPGASSFFGTSVAISGSLALIGADGESDDRGAAYIFDLRTGRQLARLTAADAGIDDYFGRSVALAGDLALIGAAGDDSDRGAAYLFHARTGAQLGKLTASNGAAGHDFGTSVALSGQLALVGASQFPAFLNGAAYTYDVSGAFLPGAVFPELAILTADDGSGFDFFGSAVSLSGHRALIGALNNGITRGAAYLFDARTTTDTPLRKFVLTDAAPNDNFGSAVSLNGNLAVIGAGGRSTAYLYDASTGGEITRLTPPDATGNGFGRSLAVSGNRVLVGAAFDGDLADNAGAAYLYRPVSVPLPLTAVAKVGDFAPGTVETNFSSFTAAYLNAGAEVGLSATLSNRRRGVWSEDLGALRPLLPEGILASGVSVAGIGEIIPEDMGEPLFQATLRSQNFSTRTRVTWLRRLIFTPIFSPYEILIQGRPYDEVNGSPALLTFPEVVQRSNSGHVLAAYTLARSATTGTTLANDSGVTYRNRFGTLNGAVVSDTRHREGEAAATGTVGDTYRQFLGRVSTTPGSLFFVFPAFYLDTTPADPLPDVIRQGVFFDQFDFSGSSTAARQGQATTISGVTYHAFLGETFPESGFAAYRALVTGTEIGRANDEGIFSEFGQAPYLREGQDLDAVNAPGVVIAGFLGYWPVESSNKIVALVKLRGPGVTKANDCAVVLGTLGTLGSDNTPQTLLREGDLVGADDASRVATIQRVDANSVNGHYHILASLTGSKARNQALFQGNAELGPNDAIKGRNLPAMVLRKGQGYQQPTGETSTIKTLTMPVSTDRTGAGAKGHGQAINNAGEVVITLEFANRSREIWKGRP
jgi:hypothetical protein